MKHLLIVTLLLAMIAPATAQDAGAELMDMLCAPEGIAEMLAIASQEITNGNITLDQFVRDMATFSAACKGLYFESDTEGMEPVIGPVEIPDGLYRITVTTTGYIILGFEELAGTCDSDGFALSRGTADMGAQTLLEASGCTALITVENTTESWTLEFEQLR